MSDKLILTSEIEKEHESYDELKFIKKENMARNIHKLERKKN